MIIKWIVAMFHPHVPIILFTQNSRLTKKCENKIINKEKIGNKILILELIQKIYFDL